LKSNSYKLIIFRKIIELEEKLQFEAIKFNSAKSNFEAEIHSLTEKFNEDIEKLKSKYIL